MTVVISSGSDKRLRVHFFSIALALLIGAAAIQPLHGYALSQQKNRLAAVTAHAETFALREVSNNKDFFRSIPISLLHNPTCAAQFTKSFYSVALVRSSPKASVPHVSHSRSPPIFL
jgi:hypothetical protein